MKLLYAICILLYFYGTTRASSEESIRANCDSRLQELSEDEFCEQKEICKTQKSASNCLRVAVVEYSRVDGVDCKLTVQQNLDAYEKIIKLAKENGAQMILFPEDGILHGSAESVAPCLEDIPDPTLSAREFNPCLQSDRLGIENPILHRLSCLARENKLYLIANYGTKEAKSCDRFNKTSFCETNANQEDGQENSYLMLNTDVIFEPSGNFIRRYRKWNPFTVTEIFDKAPKLEHVYFDSEFGRFGIFTCFDMIFKEPAIALVEEYGIDTALFPTWWFDELPILPAVQYQDGWSAKNQVNMLSSNILKPEVGSLGSSIFSRNNSLYVTPEQENSDNLVRKTKILMATIDTKPRQTNATCAKNFDPKVIEIDENSSSEKYQYKNYKLNSFDKIQSLDKLQDTKTICSGKVCCEVQYKLFSNSTKNEPRSDDIKRQVIIVRDSLREGVHKWYEQVCAVATLKEPYNPSKSPHEINNATLDLEFDREAAVSFEKLSIRASFNSKYIYPSCAHSLSKLVERSRRNLVCEHNNSKPEQPVECLLTYIPDKSSVSSNALYSFGLYARVYERDL